MPDYAGASNFAEEHKELMVKRYDKEEFDINNSDVLVKEIVEDTIIAIAEKLTEEIIDAIDSRRFEPNYGFHKFADICNLCRITKDNLISQAKEVK